MRRLSIVVAFLLTAPLAAAPASKPKAKPSPTQVPTASPTPGEWRKQLVASLNLAQGSFDNWKQGGSNFVSWTTSLAGKLEQENASVNWTTKAKLEYGLTYVGLETKKSADN